MLPLTGRDGWKSPHHAAWPGWPPPGRPRSRQRPAASVPAHCGVQTFPLTLSVRSHQLGPAGRWSAGRPALPARRCDRPGPARPAGTAPRRTARSGEGAPPEEGSGAGGRRCAGGRRWCRSTRTSRSCPWRRTGRVAGRARGRGAKDFGDGYAKERYARNGPPRLAASTRRTARTTSCPAATGLNSSTTRATLMRPTRSALSACPC
jgi:hypothetical protein